MPNINLAQIAFSRLIYQIKQAYQAQGQAMIGANPMQGVYPQPQYPPQEMRQGAPRFSGEENGAIPLLQQHGFFHHPML